MGRAGSMSRRRHATRRATQLITRGPALGHEMRWIMRGAGLAAVCRYCSKWRRAEFFDQLLTPSAYALCYAACQLLAAAFNDECQAELQARFDKLDTDTLVTAHEDLLRERERLLMFYPEFYDFVSRVLNGELARRLKLDYKPARKAVKE